MAVPPLLMLGLYRPGLVTYVPTHCLLECGCNLVGAATAVVAFEKCRLSKYVHKLYGLVI